MTFGERLVAFRKKCGMTQKKLAEILKITATRLNYWEKDKREPNVEYIRSLATALGVTTDELIGNAPALGNDPAPNREAEFIELFRTASG